MHTDPLCFTAQIYNYRLKGRLLTFLGEGGMAFPPTYALASAATVFEVVTKGGGDGFVRVASTAPKYGILRGYLRRV